MKNELFKDYQKKFEVLGKSIKNVNKLLLINIT
ncbi:hypothetical protein C8D94_101878 [Marinirhabdus gelatinilytica]|jgi:hypothetical protein|uniref:Uncharacterized protein n=1 Tax=Marinirhabdus gelatinilytica TaxID=1703343 RepID=A0A370QKY4_9FLAO|nr:hypothetical protein C8D94_101878 [Marinirhabdus gelatinilytica]